MPYDTKPLPGGFLRLKQIVAPHGLIPISRSSWWAGVSTGRFPQPVKLGPRTTAWRMDDITALIDQIGGRPLQSATSHGNRKEVLR
jgi:prophage regulatory protein